jgi:hypothetical protein
MIRIVAALVLATAATAAWACTTHTIIRDGRIVTCTTCCYGGHCTTNCF